MPLHEKNGMLFKPGISILHGAGFIPSPRYPFRIECGLECLPASRNGDRILVVHTGPNGTLVEPLVGANIWSRSLAFGNVTQPCAAQNHTFNNTSAPTEHLKVSHSDFFVLDIVKWPGPNFIKLFTSTLFFACRLFTCFVRIGKVK